MSFPPTPAPDSCAACERPAPPLALTCVYCGEHLPQRRRRLRQRAGIVAAALISTAAFAAVHGCHPLPGRLTLGGAALVALGLGLTLLPPPLRGVADASRRGRLWQVTVRYGGGMALALLAALTMLAAGAPKQWSMTDAALAATTALALLTAPFALGLPWHKLLAGLLLAAGALL
ncbi:MAG: hypothetical protein WCI17_11235 [bacterium]